jgi:enoyl-CoA hydratase
MREYDLHFRPRHQRVAKPVIAAVNGTCAGGGLQFVTDSDIGICSSSATFFDPHVSVGQTAGYSGLALAKLIPFGAAMRVVLTGRYERVSATRAFELGLVTEVVDPPEELRAVTQALIAADDVVFVDPHTTTIARSAPERVAWIKASLLRLRQCGLDDGCARVTDEPA